MIPDSSVWMKYKQMFIEAFQCWQPNFEMKFAVLLYLMCFMEYNHVIMVVSK